MVEGLYWDGGAHGAEAAEDRGSRPAYGLLREGPPLLRGAEADRTRGEVSEAGHRLYGEEEVARLKFIKKAKLLGLTLKEIAELVELAAEGSRGRVIPRLEGILETHLAETERKMAELAEFREGLLHYRDRLFEADPAKGCGCGEGVSRSRPPRISAIFSSFTNVSMAAVMSTPKRIGHSAL